MAMVSPEPRRILMLPWLAHGHISPFMELALRLAPRGFHVYLCSTPANLLTIRNTATPTPMITLVDLHLPDLPELPPHLHTTKHLPPHLMPTLKTAFDLAEPAFLRVLDAVRPHLLIHDFLQPWAPAVASSRGVPSLLLFIFGATSVAFFLNLFMGGPAAQADDGFLPAVGGEEASRHLEVVNRTAGGVSDGDRVVQCAKRSSSPVLIKSFREIEGRCIDFLASALLKKEVVPVGPLVREQEPAAALDGEGRRVMEWLDGRETGSVVLASFGSEYFMGEEELRAVGGGLEGSGLGFVWVVRYPEEGGEEGRRRAVRESVAAGRGVVMEGWAPQGAILAHRSTGGFLTHCGWSSVVEAMWHGVPMALLPLQLDQPLNARVAAEAGVGVEVRRSGDGSFDREEVARVVKEVVAGDGGEGVRRAASELGRLLREKGDEEEIDRVASRLHQVCTSAAAERMDTIDRSL